MSIKPNLSLYLPYYAEAFNESVVPCVIAPRKRSYLRSGGESFAKLFKIWPTFRIRTLDLPHTRHAR